MKQQKLRRLVGCVIVIAGLLALNYPFLAGVVNDRFAYRELQGYRKEMADSDETELNKTLETARAYNAALSAGGDLNEYRDFSMLQTGALLGYVDIPQINVYAAVRYSTDPEVLTKDLGLVEDSSLPVGGESTHAVISGHTGMASRKMLTDLTQMREGDIFFLHVLNCDMAYQVDQIVVLEPWDTSQLGIVRGEDCVTLLTCTPYGVNDHRLLVRGRRIEYDFTQPVPETQTQSVAEKSSVEKLRVVIAWASLGILVAMVIYVVVRNKRQGESG